MKSLCRRGNIIVNRLDTLLLSFSRFIIAALVLCYFNMDAEMMFSFRINDSLGRSYISMCHPTKTHVRHGGLGEMGIRVVHSRRKSQMIVTHSFGRAKIIKSAAGQKRWCHIKYLYWIAQLVVVVAVKAARNQCAESAEANICCRRMMWSDITLSGGGLPKGNAAGVQADGECAISYLFIMRVDIASWQRWCVR